MNGDTNHCAITVAQEAERGRSSHMEGRFRQTPTLLKPSASNYSCCIFRVSKSQVESNPKAYKPRIVSVGPYHHGQEQLKLIEQHKPRLFSALLDRTRDHGMDLDSYFEAVALLESRIRDSYSEALDCKTLDLIEMMVFDACFIVEIFRVAASVIKPDKDDPLFATPWIFSFLMIDLLLIENQIPFFVLQKIYDLSRSPSEADRSLHEIALGFFKNALRQPEEELKRYYGVSNVAHLLDLFRLGMVGHLELENPQAVDEDLQPMPSAKQLLLAGIKFQPWKRRNPTNVVFNHGVLRIPPLTLDAFTSSFFFNCVAFEQCYCYRSAHITAYTILMRCLLGAAKDVEFLSQRGIITNFLGTDKDVARFFNDLVKDVPFNIRSRYFAELFGKVTEYRQNKFRVKWMAMKRACFGSPWSFISFKISVVALVLSLIQAYSALHPSY